MCKSNQTKRERERAMKFTHFCDWQCTKSNAAMSLIVISQSGIVANHNTSYKNMLG